MAAVSRLLPPRQLTRSLGPGSAAAVAAWAWLAALVRRCIDWQQQAGTRGRPHQAECGHWAAAGLTPPSETGDMRCRYPFIETTPTQHTLGGAFSLSFLIIN